MQAIEFQAVAHNRYIRVPDEIPDGMKIRVLLLVDELSELNKTKVAPLFKEEKLQLLHDKLQAGENSPLVSGFNAEDFIAHLHRKHVK
jgi:hypothetical protein